MILRKQVCLGFPFADHFLEERIKLLQQRQRELEQEIETETKRGEKDRQEAERRAGGYDDILNAIDDIEGDKVR